MKKNDYGQSHFTMIHYAFTMVLVKTKLRIFLCIIYANYVESWNTLKK